MTKKILVTGGSGFLGSHLADALSDAGNEVLLFDKHHSPYLRDDQKMFVGDILNQDEVRQALKGVNYVYHLAALSDIDDSQNRPLDTMQINVIGNTILLDTIKESKVSRVIFASTIYVNSKTGSFYRVSKHACELLYEEYKNLYDINYTILRFGTLYGPRSDNTNSIYSYLKQAISEETINGIGNGQEVREYIHVEDAARIGLKVMSSEFSNETLILTGHHRMRLYELMEMINEIMGNVLDIQFGSSKDSHYQYTPYSFSPRPGRKIVLNTYHDLGQSLVQMLNEMRNKQDGIEEISI